MCYDEYSSISDSWPLSWKTRFKWFGTKEFVESRVRDGVFNNSRHRPDKYKYIVCYEFLSGVEHLVNCGKNEYMLNVRKAPLVKVAIRGVEQFC